MDKELVKNLKKGDTRSFDELFNKYGRRLYAFGLKYLGSEEDAKGLVQDVFIKVWENRKKLNSGETFKSYLFTIAYRDICNTFRKRANHTKALSEIALEVSNCDESTEKEVDLNSILDQVDQILLKMPEVQRQVFLKSRSEGMSSKEISQELDLSPGTVDNYISSALKFLKERMPDYNLIILLVAYLFK